MSGALGRRVEKAALVHIGEATIQNIVQTICGLLSSVGHSNLVRDHEKASYFLT